MTRRAQTRALLIAAALAVVAGAALAVAVSRADRRDAAPLRPVAPALAAVRVEDVARAVGLDFRHGAFRFGVTGDPVPMMGGGLCWLDYDGDGWLDLYVVNSYTERHADRWERAGGLPRNALYRNVGGRFVDVGAESGADLSVRGSGCVAADLDRDGRTDLFVTSAGRSALLWNTGDGTFAEGAEAAGVDAFGWYAGAAVGDVDRDGWPDLFVAGYADLNAPVAGADTGFPGTHGGVRDLLFLSNGAHGGARPTFREVGVDAGLEAASFEHGLGALFSDLDRDGDLDLFVANDTDPDRMYENVPWPGGAAADPAGLGFRFDERAALAGVADPNAGMGVAGGDYDGDGRTDLFVTNARNQAHGAYRSEPPAASAPTFADSRTQFRAAFGASFTGWGASWLDLDLDTDLDLLVANGAVPVTGLRLAAEPLQLIEGRTAQGAPERPADATAVVGLDAVPQLVGRGSAAADYDNDGDLDVAVSALDGGLVLLETETTAGNWLEVEPEGSRPGTEITVSLPDGRMLRRELHAGSSYLASEDPRGHFGLGEATSVRELVVRFPSGAETRLADVAANRLVVVREPPAPAAAAARAPASASRIAGCTRADTGGRSVARVWNEVLLDAIRRDVPAPTKHARNLFHVSAALWDAWAAYDPAAEGVFVTEKHEAEDVRSAREAAMSYAAYRVLLHRYSLATGVEETFAALDGTLASLCYRREYTNAKGDSPAALGNRIAAAVVAAGRADGSLERERYVDTGYRSVNEPLIANEQGTVMHDATLWQPLALARLVAQNGLPVPGSVQSYVGPHWGHVRPFALARSARGLPLDPGDPGLGLPEDPEFKRQAVDVIRKSSELDSADGVTVDVGPGAIGDNPLGTNAGDGHDVNPATRSPYAPNRVARGDWARVLAETWADGPESETPPGHWNVIANEVSDSREAARRRARLGWDRLEWDVKLSLALNGAVHDAAVAAWGAKRAYETARPISMIRYLGGNGQSSDPDLPSYHPAGLPLVPGLVEVVTPRSSAPGGRHHHLRRHVGEIAIRCWEGPPADPSRRAGVGWALASRWMPYQLATFVTPAFPGYVSGHSAFSRAAAEVLTALTGSRFFPGGLYEIRRPAGSLDVERGPGRPVVLQAATYYDAADQAGLSRLYGGIHVAADDFAGRRLGAAVGRNAWALARRYFDGSADGRSWRPTRPAR